MLGVYHIMATKIIDVNIIKFKVREIILLARFVHILNKKSDIDTHTRLFIIDKYCYGICWASVVIQHMQNSFFIYICYIIFIQ